MIQGIMAPDREGKGQKRSASSHASCQVICSRSTCVIYLLLCRFHALIEASKQDLIALGFPQFTIEDFHDVVSSYQCVNK